jgi:pimeloyl-ACP methyl ester carboxylesterase
MMVLSVVLVALGLVCVGLVLFAGWTARRIEAAVPPAGRFLTVEGVRFHYIDEGSGPVILMIHGLASQLQSFTYALNTILPGYRLVMIDRPGSGYSGTPASATFGAQAALIAAFLRALRIERALVVGHSLGGAVALALAVDRPDLVAGLVLLAPATQVQDEAPDALKGLAIRSDLMRWIIGWTLAVPSSLRAGPKTVRTLFAPDPAPGDFGTRGGGLLPVRPWTFRNASRDLAETPASLAAYMPRYSQITVPVGVLFGTGDLILDPQRHGEGLRRQIPGIDLAFVANGGHMVPLTAPQQSADLINKIAAKAGLVTEASA